MGEGLGPARGGGYQNRNTIGVVSAVQKRFLHLLDFIMECIISATVKGSGSHRVG